MDFSLLMSIYQNESPEDLMEALASVCHANPQPSQIVLVEDGPLTQALKDVITLWRAKLPQLEIYPLAENVGLGQALQYGLEKCRAHWVARLDCDDINRTNRFALQQTFLEAHPQISLLGGQIKEFTLVDGQKQYASLRQVPLRHDAILDFAQTRNPFNHMTVIFNKEHVQAVGGYQDAPGFEDYYLWLRLLKNGYQTANLPDYIVDARVGPAMIARRGGMRYTLNALTIKHRFYREGLIRFLPFLKSALGSLLVGLLPGFIRQKIYARLLRQKA